MHIGWGLGKKVIDCGLSTLIVRPCLSTVVVPALISWGRRTLLGRWCLLICNVEHHSVVHHSIAGLGEGNVVGLLVGSSMGSKTPAARDSRESWPIGAHW